MNKTWVVAGNAYFGGADELYHHGILGQKWYIRRFQNPDGSLTPEGRMRYYGNKRTLQRDLNRLERKYAEAAGDKLKANMSSAKIDKQGTHIVRKAIGEDFQQWKNKSDVESGFNRLDPRSREKMKSLASRQTELIKESEDAEKRMRQYELEVSHLVENALKQGYNVTATEAAKDASITPARMAVQSLFFSGALTVPIFLAGNAALNQIQYGEPNPYVEYNRYKVRINEDLGAKPQFVRKEANRKNPFSYAGLVDEARRLAKKYDV